MEREDGVRLRFVEEAVLEHQLGAAPFAGERRLLRRLEHEEDRARELAPPGAQHLGGAHQDRGVGVVAAGVHDPHLLSPVEGPRGRGVGEARPLGHGEGIHVRPEGDDGTGPGAFDAPHDPRLSHARPDLDAQRAQVVGDDSGGPDLLEPELGVLMEISKPGPDPGYDGIDERAGHVGIIRV